MVTLFCWERSVMRDGYYSPLWKPAAMLMVAVFGLLVVAATALGQPLVMAQMPDDGVYVLRIEDGKVAAFERGIVLVPDTRPGPGPGPGPGPEPDPDPSGLAALTSVSRAEYHQIPESSLKPVLGATVSTVYRSAAAGLRDGSLTVPAANDMVNQIRAAMPDDWAAWRQGTAKQWNALQDKGLITSPATWAAAMDAVADGIMSQQDVMQMMPDGEMINIEFIEQLVRLVMLLIDDSGQLEKFMPLILALLKLLL
jgi:hypothetical protein